MKGRYVLIIFLQIVIMIMLFGMTIEMDNKFIQVNARLDFIEDSVLRLVHAPVVEGD